jgi:hypothetical protein
MQICLQEQLCLISISKKLGEIDSEIRNEILVHQNGATKKWCRS